MHSKSEIQQIGFKSESTQIQKEYVNGESKVSFLKFIFRSLEEYLLAIFPTVTITALFIYIVSQSVEISRQKKLSLLCISMYLFCIFF